ncbi:hypothetical protein AAH978_01435 [Streptomyces sp. ZYX-F-203]
MHMNSVPRQLPREDRQEYERILDEALRSAPFHPGPVAEGRGLDAERLRGMALAAEALISAAAAGEYRHYVEVRDEVRRPSAASASGVAEPSGSDGSASSVPGGAGAGVAAVLAVLAPVLAGTAAVIFLSLGYLLRLLDPDRTFANAMITAGWVFTASTAVAILAASAGLLLTALRNRPSAEARRYVELDTRLASARDAWREALLERGIIPFLRDAREAPASEARAPTSSPPRGRVPHLGYHRPGFSTPGDGTSPAYRPRYSSPDYSSPDFGGPDHPPE